jgi:hypothetical protein
MSNSKETLRDGIRLFALLPRGEKLRILFCFCLIMLPVLIVVSWFEAEFTRSQYGALPQAVIAFVLSIAALYVFGEWVEHILDRYRSGAGRNRE